MVAVVVENLGQGPQGPVGPIMPEIVVGRDPDDAIIRQPRIFFQMSTASSSVW